MNFRIAARKASEFWDCSSNAASFFAAVRQAKAFVEAGVTEDIKANIEYMRIKSDSERNA
jgi:hypothetical protein